MSAENVEVVRRAYEQFITTGELLEDVIAGEFVWDMSTFRDWPERKTYNGVEGTYMRMYADPEEALRAAGID